MDQVIAKIATTEGVAATIDAQQRRRHAIAGCGLLPLSPLALKKRRNAITNLDVLLAVESALQGVARELRFKAKQTPGWAAAYHSACSVIEKKLSDVKEKK